MERHSHNALRIARYLEEHPCVSKVLHPGLTSHPQHKLAISQSYGHAGSLCFYIKNGTLEQTKKFLQSLKVFMWADSLGGCESLAQAPLLWFVVPTSFSDEEVHDLGLIESLIRLSCGLEDTDILIEDLNQALMTCTQPEKQKQQEGEEKQNVANGDERVNGVSDDNK
jgi:cystathionine gamma-lyase